VTTTQKTKQKQKDKLIDNSEQRIQEKYAAVHLLKKSKNVAVADSGGVYYASSMV